MRIMVHACRGGARPPSGGRWLTGDRRGGLLLARSGIASATSNLAVSAEAHRMWRVPIGLYTRVWAAGWWAQGASER